MDPTAKLQNISEMTIEDTDKTDKIIIWLLFHLTVLKIYERAVLFCQTTRRLVPFLLGAIPEGMSIFSGYQK